MKPGLSLRVDRDALREIRNDGAVMDVVDAIAASIEGTRDAERLLTRLFSEILERIPAERGAVLMAGRDGRDLAPLAFHGNPFQVQLEVCNRAFRDRTATLADTASGAMLCAPLCLRQSTIGAIYFEAKAGALTAIHFQLLIAIAAEVALSADFARYIDSLEVQKKLLEGYAGVIEGLAGNSPPIVELRTRMSRVAETGSTILILGEMGTGKELVARGIHAASSRKDGPFMAINCAAIQETLIESELFGYERGAFTGAAARKIGKVEAANRGTLFLDEVGDLKMPQQAALLRVIQEREFQRVGGTITLKVDVRILAATNVDLKQAIARGTFREDLYYRLNVVELRTPALREIREDIPLLVARFIADLRHVRVVKGISDEALGVLTRYHWPGNTRQLRNVVEHALGFADAGGFIQPENLPDAVWEEPEITALQSLEADVQEARDGAIERALQECGGNVERAAARLGISARHLWRLKRRKRSQ